MPRSNDSSLIPPWYERFPERFQEESTILKETGFYLDDASIAREIIVFKGALPEFPQRSLIITFPVSYPSVAPSVSDDGRCQLLPKHQNPTSRSYCLFGPEAKCWNSKLDSLDVIKAVKKLLSDLLPQCDQSTARDLADPFPEPVSLHYKAPTREVLLVPPVISDMLPADQLKPSIGSFRVSTKFGEGMKPNKLQDRSVILNANLEAGSITAECPKAYAEWFNRNEKKGHLYYLPNPRTNIHDIEELRSELVALNLEFPSNYDWIAVIVPEESEFSGNTRFAWKAFHRTKKSTYQPIQAITFKDSEKESRIPGLQFLKKANVTIIGCGSLGSKLATNLAASGVEKFSLFDKDHMDPANSIRHECGVQSFGLPKTLALIRRMVDLNPNIADNMPQLRGCLGHQSEHSEEQINIELIKKSNLVINATGHGAYSRYINEICYRYGIPSIHVSVTNGAWSGEVVRVIPRMTPCWLCWDHAYGDEECSPPSEKMPDSGFLFAPGCDQPTFTGATHDVGMVANLATSFAIDTMKLHKELKSEYKGHYLVWHGRDKEGFLSQWTEVKDIPWRGPYTHDGTGCTMCRINT